MEMEQPMRSAGHSLQWKTLESAGQRPSPRGGHSTVCAERNLIVFGGHAYVGDGKFLYYNDVHLFDADENCWHDVHCKGRLPESRYGHSSTLVGNRMFVFGGKGKAATLRDMCYLDLESWTWAPLTSSSHEPPARMNHSSVRGLMPFYFRKK